jgi:hypothetical protein
MSERPRASRLELAATVLLAVAAVATAWSSYQANRWNGEQAKAASMTNAIRIDAARAQGEAQAETEVDVALFIQWVDADAHDEDELAAFYATRFRDEFQPAFDAWLATDPFADPEAPPSPFAMEEYQVEAQAEAQRLDRESEASAAAVRRDIQRSANYVLAVVLFAVALFFAGISVKLADERLRAVLLGVGYVVFLGAVAWVATFPISFAV